MNIDEVLAQVRPKTTKVRVCLRGDLLAQHEQLEADLAAARRDDETQNRHAEAPAIARQVMELLEQIEASSTDFEFTAIGQRAWTDLLAQHTPSDEHRDNGYGYDPTTFPVAAVAASASQPKMSAEQAERLYGAINFGQWQQIWGACLNANVEGTSVPFSAAASAVLRGSATKFASPTTSELPAAFSSDE